MKRSIQLTLLLLILFTGTQQLKAQDGFFSNARTLEQGAFAVGIQPVILNTPDDMMLIGRVSYGLHHSLTGHVKAGFLAEEEYFGVHFEGNIASEPSSDLSVALLGGVYTYGDTGLKLGMNISKNFHPVSLYTGLNYQPLFADNTTVNAVLIPAGLDVHVDRGTLDLVVEADIPVNDDAEYLEALTFGARIYLN